MEDDQGDLTPVRPFGFRIEQTQIRHEVLFVVTREDAGAGAVSETGGSSGGDCIVGPYEVHYLSVALWMPAFKRGCVNDAGLAEAAPRSGA